MSKLTDLLVAAEELRRRMPGFRTIPLPEEVSKENSVVVALEITTGPNAGVLVAVKSVEIQGEGMVAIDYAAFDEGKNDATEEKYPTLGEQVGSIVDYFLVDGAIQMERAAEAIAE